VTGSPDPVVLDTSAILAFWNNEDGAAMVEKVLRESSQRKPVYLSFMTFMECRYRVWKDHGQSAADELVRSLKNLPVIRVDVDDALIRTASELKAQHKISVADSWIIATAITRNATLVHKDPEFDALADRVAMKTLPYKKTK
jgi:predicted nucleic acid-binding protein